VEKFDLINSKKTEPILERDLQRRQEHPLVRSPRFKYVPLLIIALLILNLLTTCNNSRVLQKAIENKPYIYVQNPDGKTIQATPSDPLYRSDATLSKFSDDWLKLAFSWKTPPEKGEAFVNERKVDFPYQFYEASLAIQPGYREAYMDRIAQKYQRQFPLENYITGQWQSDVKTYQKPKIQPVEKGVWDVAIVATRTHAVGLSIFAREVFNHVIRVRAIDPATDDGELWGNQDTHLGKLLAKMQRQGLQIIQIDEF